MKFPAPCASHGLRRRQALGALGAAALSGGALWTARPAAGQSTVPAWRPKGVVRIVVPFAAGGTSDLIARIIAVRLSNALGESVIVDNRVGAGGNIGIAAVARAAPDARTLLLVSSAFVTNPAIYTEKPPYDPLRQFAPVSLAVSSPDVIVVPVASPLTSLTALVEEARRRPGALNYATPGKGNSVHLGGELLWQRAGIELTHVPYNGAAPAVQAVLGAQVDCALIALPAAQTHIAAGRLRALCVGSSARWVELPKVPTVAECGFDGYRSETMQALFAPAGTPLSAIERLHAEVRRILMHEDVQRQSRALGFETVAGLPAELAARVAEEVPRWKAVAARAHIRAD